MSHDVLLFIEIFHTQLLKVRYERAGIIGTGHGVNCYSSKLETDSLGLGVELILPDTVEQRQTVLATL